MALVCPHATAPATTTPLARQRLGDGPSELYPRATLGILAVCPLQRHPFRPYWPQENPIQRGGNPRLGGPAQQPQEYRMSATEILLYTQGSSVPTSRFRPRGLDISKLKNVKLRGGVVIAQCPVCAAEGRDSKGQHLAVFDEGHGAFSCITAPRDKVHNRAIAALAGLDAPPLLRRRAPRHINVTPRPKPDLAALRVPTDSELQEIAGTRHLPSIAGLQAAVHAGHLWVWTTRDYDEVVNAWVQTDSARVAAQARRMDGRPWRSANGAKAKTLKNSIGAWPIGSADIGNKPFVALCEGGPDTLAVWTLAAMHGRCSEIAPVCMAGASMRIHPKAAPYFRGKGVWIYPHSDDAGKRAVDVWTADLRKSGVEWVKPFEIRPHKDLNDYLAAMALERDSAV
jgi:hypothetical protein